MTRPLPFALALGLAACASAQVPAPAERPAALVEAAPLAPSAWFNLDHLDYLGEDVVVDGDSVRLVHIYAEAPDFRFVGDDDEGIACVDDVARAAVLYLHHLRATGDPASQRAAVKLLRFVRRQQTADGLIVNFVWDRQLRPNTEHPYSRADKVEWWTARAVWALGVGAEVLAQREPAEAAAALAALRRVEPHLDRLLDAYGETAVRAEAGAPGRPASAPYPLWMINGIAGDATSELVLGLAAAQRAAPTEAGARRVRQFTDGLALTRRGDLRAFPFGGFASWPGSWHGWGNSQTQALAEAASAGLASEAARGAALAEATTFYPRLLVEGWRHEMPFPTESARPFEQIAYMVRPVAVGSLRLFELTGDARFAVTAGLAAAWLTGDNAAAAVMADPATGRGYDGILSPTAVNANAGAESTIEAQLTLFEVERVPEAARWLGARGGAPQTVVLDGRAQRFRTWRAPDGTRAVVVLDPERDTTAVLSGAPAAAFLDRAARAEAVPPGRAGSALIP